jgi:hypothetical protein
MRGRSDPQDDARRTGDALDRVIDEAVEAALRAGPVDLRAQVLTRLDEPVDSQRRPSWISVPALLPVAGTLLMMVGVGVLWQHANEQLGRSAQYAASIRASSGRAAAPTATPPAPPTGQLAIAEPAVAASQPARVARVEEARAPKAPAWLESDNDQKMVGASALLAEVAIDEPVLPGAPGGDLGDPISPMPKLRPIVIQPIATLPMSNAPPVSTLSKPASPLTEETPRDRQDPAKSGGK